MAEQKRRRKGPHDGEATRATLMDAAERLFAEQGVEAVSVRAVNAAAGLAPAAVHYHFGTKEALLDAVLLRRGREVVADISARCDALLAQAGRPDPEEILEALIAPYAALLERDRAGGARWLSIVGQLTLSGSDQMMPSAAPATDRLQTLIHRAFPDTPADDLTNAWSLTVEALILLMARGPESWFAPGDAAYTTRRTLLAFAVGGLRSALGQPRTDTSPAASPA
ncbi:TetR/AcrR family transcriptional regulator [Streptomyces sp. NPDC046909]|uniref:TetR/AcrR family transcriptional regulator n=1 Tax=Streptomyces sp. NPDC046909 TaxID=3155617 RepID=UPI0033CC2B26